MSEKIKTIEQLYWELDSLFKGILEYCKKCHEEDCKGYIWVLSKEVPKLIKRKVALIEINHNINFLDSFVRINNKIDTEVVRPPCIYRDKKGICTIYKYRPFVCRFYPLDFIIRKGQIFVIMHTDCLFYQKLNDSQEINKFLAKVRDIFYNCSKPLLKHLTAEYKKVSNIAKYPADYKHDDYIIVLNINNINKDMSKCKAVLDSKKIKTIRVKSKSKKSK